MNPTSFSIEKTPPEEFSELLRCYGSLAYRMAYHLTGGRESEARDLVQDGFIKIWHCWKTQRPQSFKGWMYRLLHNLYMDTLRRHARHPVASLDVANGSDSSWEQGLPDRTLSLQDTLEQQELQKHVSEALGRLDIDFRIPVVLCDMEGLSYDEIAQILACPVGTVRSRIHRGRLQLRRLLQPLAPCPLLGSERGCPASSSNGVAGKATREVAL